MREPELRHELAGELGRLMTDRQEIINLVQAYVPDVDIADLPPGSARAAWIFVLTALANRRNVDGLRALLDEGGRRSKRVDWERFESLLVVTASPSSDGATTTLWSQLDLDVRWPGEGETRRARCRASSDSQLLEVLVTLEWEGAPPPTPNLDLRVGWLLAGSAVPIALTRNPSTIQNVASWSARHRLAPGTLTTRKAKIIASSSEERRSQVRYLASSIGSWLALSLWLGLALFLFVWLTPLGIPISIAGLGVWAATFVLGWAVPRLQDVWGSWSWVTRVWEFTLPAAIALTALAVVVPRFALVTVRNRSSLPIRVNNSPVEAGTRTTVVRAFAEWSYDKVKTCVCSKECPCPPAPTIRGVPTVEIVCRTPDGERCADWEIRDLVAGVSARIPFGWPKGLRNISLSQSAMAATRRITTDAGTIDIIKAEQAPITMLPVLAGTKLKLELAASGVLDCELAHDSDAPITIDKIDIAPKATALKVDVGPLRSRWQGDGAAYACMTQASTAEFRVAPLKKGQLVKLPGSAAFATVSINDSAPVACAVGDTMRLVDVSAVPAGVALNKLAVARIDESLGATCRTAGGVLSALPTKCTLYEDKVSCTGIATAPRAANCTLTPSGAVNDVTPTTSSCKEDTGNNATTERIRKIAKDKGWQCTRVYICT